jgi:membrane fusion protein, multidrug efflux system
MSSTEKETILEEELSDKTDEMSDDSVSKRSRLPIYVVGGIVFASALIGLVWWLYTRQFVTTDDATLEGNITLVSPKISAHVAHLHIEENQYVKKGDLLIELDAKEFEAKAEQAKATLQMAFANRDKAKANLSLTRVTNRAGLNQANSNLKTSLNTIEQSKYASSTKKNAIDQARSQSNTAAANLKQVQAQIPAAEGSIEQAKAQVIAAKNKFEVAKLEYERDKRLFDDQVVSKQKLDLSGRELSEAQAGLVSAEKQVEISQSKLNALQRQVEVENSRLNESKFFVNGAENDYLQSLSQVDVVSSQADESAGRLQEAKTLPERFAVEETEIGAAEAQVQQAQASFDQAELELSYTKILAPQDGFVSHRTVQEGQLVQPDQSLLTITQGGIWVVANFKETQIEKIKAGQAVDIYIDAYPSAVFRGKVESFQAGTGSRFNVLPAENSSGNFVKVVQRVPVKIVFDEMPDSKKYLLVPGMSVIPKVRVR